MKMTYIIIGSVLLLGLIIYLTSCGNKSTSADIQNNSSQDTSGQKVHHPKENAYEGLRKMAFDVTPDQLGLNLSKEKTEVYGVIMDWEMSGAVATTICYMSGDASMYTSTGGGIIGGGQHQNVSSASKQLVTLAQTYLDRAIKTETTSLPEKDNVKFYLLTNKGVYVGQEIMTNLENNTSKWLGLFEESNKVLTELRNISGHK